MRAIDFFTLYIFSAVALVCVGSLKRLTFVWWVSKAFRSLYNTSQSAWRSSKDFRRRWEADQLVPVCSGDIPSFVRRNSFNPKRGNCDFWLEDEDSGRRCTWSTCTNGDAAYVSNVDIDKYGCRCFVGQIDLRTQHTTEGSALLMSLQLSELWNVRQSLSLFLFRAQNTSAGYPIFFLASKATRNLRLVPVFLTIFHRGGPESRLTIGTYYL